jgi:DNA repair ATPase RecN
LTNNATTASVASAPVTTPVTYTTNPIKVPTSQSSPRITPQPSPIVNGKSNWSDLTAEQKAALAPLATEWNKMDDLRKKKWLGIADKYANMKPEEQQRVQERVQAWVKMTPEQRMAVRENFANTAKKSPEQKSAQWQEYQQLSEEEKAKLANEAKTKKTITTIQPESKRTSPILAPLKKGPPPINPASSAASQAIIK